MGQNQASLRKEFQNRSCPADLPLYESGMNPAGTTASISQVIAAAAPHACIIHYADTDHYDSSIVGMMNDKGNLDSLKRAGFTDIAIEAPQGLQHWNDKLVNGALTRPEFEEKIDRALMSSQGNAEGQWTRQIGATAEYARDHDMRFHFADPQNGAAWCNQNLSPAALQRCEVARINDRYDDTGGLASTLKDPVRDKIFLMYGANHFSVDNGSREAAGGSYLKIDVYRNRQAYEGSKTAFQEDHAMGVPTNQLKPDLVYMMDEKKVYTTCHTDPALKQEIEALHKPALAEQQPAYQQQQPKAAPAAIP